MFPTRNTLSESIRTQSIEILNKHLAAVAAGRHSEPTLHDEIANWANEGGAGGEVNRST